MKKWEIECFSREKLLEDIAAGETERTTVTGPVAQHTEAG